MTTIDFAEIFGNLSAILGVVITGVSFLLPRGWRSPLGVVLLGTGLAIVTTSLVHSPAGPTYSKLLVARIFNLY